MKECKELFQAERIHFIARANYREGSELDRFIKQVMKVMVEGIFFQEESLRNYIKHKKA
jgi:hypothetical protein